MFFSKITKRFGAAVLAVLLMCTLALPAGAQAEKNAAYSAQLNITVDGQALSLKLSFDPGTQTASIQAQAAAQGQPLAQLGLYCSREGIALEDSTMLGGTYGIDLTKLGENLPASVFAPNSGSVLALDPQLYNGLLEKAKQDGIGGADGPTAILAAGNLTAVLMQSVNTQTRPGELVLESGTIQTTEVTVQLDAQGMVKLAKALLGQKAEAPQEALDALEARLTQGSAAFTATAALDRKTKALLSLEALWSFREEAMQLQIVPAAGTYSLVRSSENGQSSTTALTVEENTEDAFALTLANTTEGKVRSQLHFRWDKQKGTYALDVSRGEELDQLTGTIQTGKDSLVITADTANGQPLTGCTLTLRRDDPTRMPQFLDILTMSQDEILQLLHTAMGSAQELLG